MNNLAPVLPAGFTELEPFVERWAITGSAARAQLRNDSTPEERQDFFNAAKDLLLPALERLDQTPLSQHTESEDRLMNLMLSFAHVAMAVEMQGAAETRHATYREVMKITRSPAGA